MGGTYVELSEGVTHYEMSGPLDGKPVILIHGATIPSWDWDFQVDALTDVGLKVIRYDHFGRGWSDRPEATYDTEFYVRQLNDLVDAMEIDGRVSLVGHSLGGAIAARYASVHPHKVERIGLVAPVVNSVANRTPFEIARIPLIGAFSMRTITLDVLSSRAASFFERIGPAGRVYDERYREQMRYEGFERSLHSLFKNNMVDDHREAYGDIARAEIPVIVVWGTGDEDIPRDHIEHLRVTIPRADVRLLDGVGHTPTLEAPDQLNPILSKFLGD